MTIDMTWIQAADRGIQNTHVSQNRREVGHPPFLEMEKSRDQKVAPASVGWLPG
jgi:hypothetical protein